MGVYVNLEVRPKAIDPAAWAAAYDETLTLLRSYPAQLMGYAWRPLLGREVPMYTRDIEQTGRHGRHWCVVGDRVNMRFAESFEMSRERSDQRQGFYTEQEHDTDIVLGDPEKHWGVRVFGAKTQGEPYHLAILGAGLVIEARFPGAALLFGDIDESGAQEAQRWAEDVLGRAFPLPVLLDAPSLLQRLSVRWRGVSLIQAFVRRFLGEKVAGLAHVFTAVEGEDVDDYLRLVISRRDAREADVPAPSDVVRAFLLATGDLARMVAIASAVVSGEEVASLLVQAGVLLPAELRNRPAQCQETPFSLRPDVRSLGSLLSAMYLDQDWSRPAFDEGAIETALSSAYPAQAAALLQQVRDETKKRAEHLRYFCDTLERGVQFQAELEPYQDVGELVALRSAEELGRYGRERLTAFAYVIHEAVEKGGSGTRKDLVQDVAKARRFLVSLAAERGPLLTEYAWEWILNEDDPDLVGLVIDLFCCEPGSDESARLRRAILESRVLAQAVAKMMRDEAAMAEGSALVEQGRRAQEQRRAGRDAGAS